MRTPDVMERLERACQIAVIGPQTLPMRHLGVELDATAKMLHRGAVQAKPGVDIGDSLQGLGHVPARHPRMPKREGQVERSVEATEGRFEVTRLLGKPRLQEFGLVAVLGPIAPLGMFPGEGIILFGLGRAAHLRVKLRELSEEQRSEIVLTEESIIFTRPRDPRLSAQNGV